MRWDRIGIPRAVSRRSGSTIARHHSVKGNGDSHRVGLRAVVARVATCVTAACLWGSPANAQYGVDTWTTDQGLPQNLVHSLLQTRDGYIWFSTLNGLVRFDGVKFTVFDKTHTPGIPTNRLGALYESSDGTLWVASENGGLIRYSDNRFTTYTTEHGLPHPYVRGVTGDDEGHVWVLSNGRIVSWENGGFHPADVAGVNVDFAASEWDTQVFWGLDDTMAYRFSRGRISTRPAPPMFRRLGIARYAEDPSGTLWMVMSDGRIARLDEHGRVTFHRLPGRSVAGSKREPAGEVLHMSYRDHQGQDWALRVTDQLERFLTLPDIGGDREILLRLFFEDREDNLWLTSDQGLHRVRRRAVATYSQQHGLVNRNVYPVYQDRKGAVWIGAWDSGLSRFEHDRFTNFTVRDGLPSGLVSALFEDREGRLWVAAHGDINGGLRIFQGGRLVEVENEIAPAQSRVHAIHQDRSGALWFGSTHGLVRYANDVATLYTTDHGLPSSDVHVIVEETAGDLWIGLYGGLARFHHGTFTAWTERDGLPSNSVRALHLDVDGALWIGTYDGGLGRFKNGRFTRITTHEGLYDDGVFQILEDGGYLWMTSNRGIHRAALRDLNAVADGSAARLVSMGFGTSEGLLNAECNGGSSPAGIKAKDGTLWFPTQDGVAVVDPSRIGGDAINVPVKIESVLIDRNAVPFDAIVRIAPGQESFEVAYTGLSFVQSDRLTFRYRLNGLDREWVDAGTRRTAYYSYVPPGNYTFSVTAASSDGIWSTSAAQLPIVVAPPFWRTWWFMALCGVLAVAAARVAYRQRVSALERARLAQETFSRQLIGSQERERRRIAAELHDSLGQQLLVIKNRALLGALDGEGSPTAHNQFDQIVEAASQSIDEVRQIAYDLRPYHLDRLGLTNSIEDLIESVAASSEIEFSTEIAPIDGAIPKDMEINLYRIVQESLNNIVKHSGSRHASIGIARADHKVIIRIRDDGKGFDTKAVPKTASPSGGFGMAGISERVGMLGGRHTVTSSPGQGTTIEIQVPARDM